LAGIQQRLALRGAATLVLERKAALKPLTYPERPVA
jgi:hypothetical protein